MAPFAHGQWLSSPVGGVAAHLELGEGYLSGGLGGLGRMLDDLVSAAAKKGDRRRDGGLCGCPA
jgi:hypothetical protein